MNQNWVHGGLVYGTVIMDSLTDCGYFLEAVCTRADKYITSTVKSQWERFLFAAHKTQTRFCFCFFAFGVML